MSKIRGFFHAVLLCSAAALAACGSSSGDSLEEWKPPGVQAGVVVVSGNHQTAPVGTELPQPLVGRVIDAAGNALSNRPVTFVVASGGGSLSVGSTTSDSGGLVSGRWTLGTTAGTQRVEVRGTNSDGANIIYATFESVAMAGAAKMSTAAVLGLTALLGDEQTVEQHTRNAKPLVVFVSDVRGAGVPGIAVDFSPAPGSAYFVAQTINTNAEGYADLTAYFHEAGAVRVEATVAGVPSATFDLAVTATPFDYDGDFICRFAEEPGSPYSMSVKRSSVSAGDLSNDVAADGIFALEWRVGDIRRRLQGRIEVSIDGGARAIGTTIDSAAPMPWMCERL